MAENEEATMVLALRAIIALGDKEFDEGKGIPADEVFAALRQKKGIDA